MLKLTNATAGDYRLTVEYREREYSYIARRISSDIGEELWFVWAANNRMLRLIYNTATKKLREDLMPGQKGSIPEEFLKAMESTFSNR